MIKLIKGWCVCKKNLKIAFFLLTVFILNMTAFTACENIPDDWPTPDEMIENLQNKGYTITDDDKIKVKDEEYSGRVVIGEKGSEFVAGFWTEDIESAEAVHDYWGEKYQAKYILRVGTTVYCGTSKAVKHASINVK